MSQAIAENAAPFKCGDKMVSLVKSKRGYWAQDASDVVHLDFEDRTHAGVINQVIVTDIKGKVGDLLWEGDTWMLYTHPNRTRCLMKCEDRLDAMKLVTMNYLDTN